MRCARSITALAFSLLVLMTLNLFAAAPTLGSFFSKGSVSGGQAHAGHKAMFSIVLLQKLNNPSTGIERLVLTFGDQDGLPLSTPPGYFHVSIDSDGKRVVIDLAQLQKTTVDQSDLSRVLKDSMYVSSSTITMDPVDLSTNIVLQMKKPIKVRASLDKDERKINQLVLDFDKI